MANSVSNSLGLIRLNQVSFEYLNQSDSIKSNFDLNHDINQFVLTY